MSLSIVLSGCLPRPVDTVRPLVIAREAVREDGIGRGPGNSNSYSFIDARTEDTKTPSGWFDSCEPLRYRISTTNAPQGGVEEIQEAVARIAEASGYSFEFVGFTEEVPGRDYGEHYDRRNHFPPMLLAWADRATVEAFGDAEESGGELVGIGGPVRIQLTDGSFRYVSAVVMVVRELFPGESRGFDGRWSTGQIWLHELGHALGLNHTEDFTQAMYERLDTAEGFGSGDLEGLRKLSNMPCRTEWAGVATAQERT